MQRKKTAPPSVQHSLQRVAEPRYEHRVAPMGLEAMLSELSENEKKREAAMLSELAAICVAFAELPLKDKANPYFQALIRFASDRRIVDDSQLAGMGDTTRESANRWVNGKATTNLATQRQVLRLLASHAAQRARELSSGRP